MKYTIWKALTTAAVVAMMAAACGGGSSSTPSTPTAPTTPPTGGTPSDTATITIGSNGAVSPSSVTITRGGRVTFVNNDSRAHDMASDPHPEHTTCPELNQIGFMTSGQSRTSGNLNTARTCTFHDHNLPADRGLQGSIIIQ
jgi:plastocyanin